jgi:hypothetical protein
MVGFGVLAVGFHDSGRGGTPTMNVLRRWMLHTVEGNRRVTCWMDDVMDKFQLWQFGQKR